MIIVAQHVERAGVKDGILRTAVIGCLGDRPCGIERAHDAGELAGNGSGGAVVVCPLLHDLVPDTPHEDARMVTVTPHRSEEHTSELQSLAYLVCRLLL